MHEKDIGLSKRVGVLYPYTYLVCGYKNADRPYPWIEF